MERERSSRLSSAQDFVIQQFSEANDASLICILESKGYTLPQVITLIKKEGANLISQFLEDPFTYAYQLGMLLADQTTLSAEVEATLQPRHLQGQSAVVSPYHTDLSLCGSSESNLIAAVRDEHMAVIVADSLFMKFYGKPTAYCAATVTTTGGTFVQGNWYSPGDEKTRTYYKQVYFSGEGRFAQLQGEWALMRGIDHSHEEYPFIAHVLPMHPEWILEALPYTNDTRQEQYNRFKNAHIDFGRE
ncbi:hypothetical protein BH11PAT1_BH11PAT1_2040 [soil metagenome]